MKITTRTVGKCKVIDCGRLTIGSDTASLFEAVREAVLDGTSKVILNLKDVPYIDSQMLGIMIRSYTHAKNVGGDMVLLNVGPKLRSILDMLKLATLFDIFDNEQKALEGCEQRDIQPEKEAQ